MHAEQNKIHCPLFNEHEPVVGRITEEINKAHGQQKAWWAEELLKELKPLLECPRHDGARPDCANCRTVSQLRGRTAELALKAGKLA